MKTILAVLLFTAFGAAQTQTCKMSFVVLIEDALGNIDHGLPAKDAEWVQRSLGKKYPSVCYAGAAADSDITFFISIKPATYRGSRTVHDTNTNTVPVTGTITDQDGNQAAISGTQQVTTTSSSEVPYEVNYGLYTLYLQHRGPDGKYGVVRAFQQEGLYNTITFYGIPLGGGGRGKHPERAVIEDAVKWLAAGGLGPLVTWDSP